MAVVVAMITIIVTVVVEIVVIPPPAAVILLVVTLLTAVRGMVAAILIATLVREAVIVEAVASIEISETLLLIW